MTGIAYLLIGAGILCVWVGWTDPPGGLLGEIKGAVT